MRRRQFLGLTAGLAGAAGLSACGSADAGSGEVILKLVAAEYGDDSDSGSSERYWNELAKEFRQENPGIRVDVSVFGWDDVDAEVAAMVKAGRAPDIAQMGSYADFAALGELHPVGEILSLAVQSDFIPALAEAGEFRRVQYGIPFVAGTRLFFYNKALFQDAGLDPDTPPRDWDELRDAARALADAGVPVPYGLPLGPEEAQAECLQWMLAGGGHLTDSSDVYTIDSEANMETFTWLRDELVGTGLTGGGDPAATARREVFAGFAAGEVGMLNGHPSLLRQAERGKIDYGLAQVPGRHGPTERTMGVADWLMGFSRTDHRAAVKAFLDFVYTTENVASFAERYELLPVTTPAHQAMLESEDHERLRPFLSQLPGAVSYPVGKISWAEVAGALKTRIGEAVQPGSDISYVLSSLQRQAVDADLAHG
ncbi:extracellular solute-binding protein [Streptomyces sp. ACA25]|uniref:ABC transporter substrate-binding protein n=1 Tax=Streptomyces sp. ACA25 TaxID=3022596 RepID=UPI0023076E3B|nr:extracellular solute-binding protein [Streptomyces sp. ACA25]MDB1088039.1 extracellular solute-binding protein [Streptomyces sp. ACA25]